MGLEIITTCDSCGKRLGNQGIVNTWSTIEIIIENEVESAIVGSPMQYRAIWCADCREAKLKVITELMKSG